MGEVISSGSRVVLNGQIIEDPDVQLNGKLYINNGGSANNARVHGGGQYFVLSNGKDTSASILSGGTMQVNQGSSVDLQIFDGGIVTGGGAYLRNAVVKSGGNLTLSAIINKAGNIAAQCNVQNTTINEGGVMKLDKFAAANMTKINGGSLLLFNGAEAYDVRLSSGYINVSCGSAYDVTMSGGSMLISGNGVLDQGVVEKLTQRGGVVWVEAGGVVSNGDIYNTVRVYQYGHLEDTVVRASGTVYLDGGEQHGGIVHGSETIREDGAAYNVTFNGNIDINGSAIGCNLAGGDVTVSEGGFFSGTANMSTGAGHATFNVHSGGTAIVTKASGKRVNAYLAGGVMDLNAGGITFVQLLENGGGTFNLRAGASAAQARLAAGVMNVEGVLRDATVSSGGSVMIAKGGVITGNFYFQGGVVSAAAGGIVDFDISGSTVGQDAILGSLSLVTGTPDYSLTVGESQAVGTYTLAGGAAGFNKTLTVKNSAGTELGTLTVDGDVVGYSGKVFGLKLNGEILSVTAANGSAENVFMGSVTSETKEITSGMTALGATVNEKGLLSILSKGTASNTMVNFGGEMVVSSGGKLKGVTIEKGGTVSVLEDVMATNVVVNGGTLVLDNYGWAYQGSGTGNVSSNTIVKNGGRVIVHENAWLVGAILSDGGRVDVLSDGNFSAGKVTFGEVYAFEGATVTRLNVEDGGVLCVESGAKVENIYVNAGGVLTGVLSDAFEIRFYGGTLDLDISSVVPNNDYLISEDAYARIMKPDYLCTITVDDSQEQGTYQLIEGAGGFDKSITVVTTSGIELCTLTVGGSATFGSEQYTLSQDTYGSLSLTIADAPEPPAPGGKAKSDIDGNGISDVMFVWTGEHGDGNYQHGYWMNGTSEWQSVGVAHPAEWDNLGCYDMTGDGKADSVLFGNVTSEAGVHGAYIGYYADANDLDANWVNIGYLTNEDNIDWKNKVGNLTGNASGANSIVWYTHELGALGAWTDGTENWVSIKGGFNADWTLVGCGDFSGDGKDQVVMSYNSGAKYYAYAIDGSYTELGDSDSGWTVRAIGDFAGDGKDDIVAFHQEYGIVAMWADGLAANWSQLGQLDAKDWFVVGAGDYDGDGSDDLLVRQISTGMLGYYGSGDMAQWNVLGYGVDMNWTVIA